MSYVFDRNFDAESEATQRGEVPIIGAVYTRADFDAAVAEARAAGFEAGHQHGLMEAGQSAEHSDAARRLAVAEAVVPALHDVFANADRHHAALEAQMVDFVLSVFNQVAPDVTARLAEGQARREALGAVRMALGTAHLELWFAPESLDAAKVELERSARQAGFGGQLSVRADPDLGSGDVRASWDHGAMHFSFREICGRILEALGLARQDIELRLGTHQAGDEA